MAKRGQNEGSIYKREDGRWAGVINLGYQNGKLKRKTFYAKTRKEVQEKLTVALKDFQQGISPASDKQTIAQFLERWLEDSIKNTVRPRTYQGYEQTIRLHVIPYVGKIALSKLSPQHVQSLLNDLSKGGLGARTVAYTRSVLRAALNQALRWQLVQRNAAALVDPPKYKKPEVVPLTPEQSQTFLDYLNKTNDRLSALYSVSLALGLRLGEATGLRWKDIDLDNKTLRVNVALQRVDGKLKLVEPKTKKSSRGLPLPEIILTSLKNHRKQQLTEKLLAGKKWQETGLVFTTTIGTPLDPRNVLRLFQCALENAKLPKCRFHDLRHSCASLLLSQGVPARTVMEILGHSQINLTLDTYSHVMPEMKQEVADIMDKILTRKSPKDKLINK